MVAFDSTTKAFDFLLSFLYAILLLGFVAFGLYIINYAPLNLNSFKTLSRYGSLYAHMKYKRENKLISNEFCLRQILKMSMASIHVFGYFSPIAVSFTGFLFYFGSSIMILGSFWFNGVYASVHQTFKMAVFHFVLAANYVFAGSHVNREVYEIFIVSFLQQLMNGLTILYLIAYSCYSLFLHLKNIRNNKQQPEYDEDDSKTNLDVSWRLTLGLRKHGHIQERRHIRQHGTRSARRRHYAEQYP